MIDASREAIRQELMAIADEHNGYVAPEHIIEAAKNPDSPPHSQFLWDDTEGGHRFRLLQAAMLLRRIRITVIRNELPESKAPTIKKVRMFQSDPDNRKTTQGSYAPVMNLMEQPEKRQRLLDSAVGELKATRKRYEELSELASIWAVIDSLEV